MRPHKRYIVQVFWGLFFGDCFFGTVIQLIFQFLTQQIVDTGINIRKLNFKYLILITQMVLLVSQTALSVFRNWIILHVTSRMNLRIVSDFIMKLMNPLLSILTVEQQKIFFND
jgi:ATP-binding cassette subfamily B protein